MAAQVKRLIIGITGASGVVYGIRLLQLLREVAGVAAHLVISPSAAITLNYETELNLDAVQQLADVSYKARDVAAAISSGSFATMGMIIAPCSMRSLAEIASGVTSSLLTRAADVVLKERRRLVLMARETPLTTIHLRNMLQVTEAGGIIAPPVPGFYTHPKDLDEMVSQSCGRVLDLFDITLPQTKRWDEENH